MPAVRWILTFVFFAIVATENNCYRKNLCYGLNSGARCADSTTLINCAGWKDYPTVCLHGCVENSVDNAYCGCLNNCSGIGTCSSGQCKCPMGYTGDDCSSKSVCAGLSNGYYCINSTYIQCANQQAVYQFRCKYGCSSSGCYCPNNCSGFTCDTYGSCQCPTNRTGDDCSIINPCPGNINTHVCVNTTASALCSGTYLYGIVNCPYGCEKSTGICECQCNGRGTCTQGVCTCYMGYYGANCEHVSPCYEDPKEYGYSCEGNQRIYCSSSDYSVMITNCSTSCVTEYSYSQCQCACDSTHDKYAYCLADGSCSCNSYWKGPHCWTLPISPHGICSGETSGYSTHCNGSTTLVSCSGNYIQQMTQCQYGCLHIGLGGDDRCMCPIGPNGLECSGAGTCNRGTCLCDRVGVGLDCSMDPCTELGIKEGILCTNNYTAVQCINYKSSTKMLCTAGCVTEGRVSQCNMDCGPYGTPLNGECKCNKGYSACPLGFRGDTCQEPISACSLVNATTPVITCEGNQAVTCVQHIAVNATTCDEGCLNGKCICNSQNRCSGHGTCLDGVCQCDIGWSGVNCKDRQLANCANRANGRYCTNHNETGSGEVYWCFKQLHVGSEVCEGRCSEETAKCLCPFDCHGHGKCNDGVCFCTGLWFGPYCKYSGFTIVLQIVGAAVLIAAVLLGFFMITSYKHTRQVPLYRLDQARKTDYDFSEEEVVLMDSNVEGYQSMGKNAFHRLFKKRK